MTLSSRAIRLVAAITLLCGSPLASWGDGTSKLDSSAEPWSAGVSSEKRAKARSLFARGNTQFEADRHIEALRFYERALKLWNHPRIRINAAASLVELGRYVDAGAHIENASEYRDALARGDRAIFDRVKTAIEANTSIVVVESRQAKVVVTIDGVEVLAGPGVAKHRITPGKHELVARRDGLEPFSQTLDIPAGNLERVTPVLFQVDSDWRWSPWKPWVLAGFGAAVATVGVPLILDARSQRDERRAFEQENCVGPDVDCGPGSDNRERVLALDRSADQRTLGANVAFVSGGVILATGLVLAIVNRPRKTRRPAPEVSAWFDRDGGIGAVVSARF